MVNELQRQEKRATLAFINSNSRLFLKNSIPIARCHCFQRVYGVLCFYSTDLNISINKQA